MNKPSVPDLSLPGRTVLILGKNSYIGQFLCAHLKQHGATVIAVGSDDCDLRDKAQIDALLASHRHAPLTLIFLAVVNKNVHNSYEAFLDNLTIARNVATSVNALDLDSLIYFSSADVYGIAPVLPVTENTPLNPDGWYGLSKLTSEWILRYELAPRSPLCILRVPGIYGRSSKDRSVIGKLIAAIRTQQKVTVHGDGQTLRDYVFAPDLCRAVESLILNKVTGTFNLATGKSISLNEIIATIRHTLNLRFDVAHAPADPERNFDLSYDTAQLKTALGHFEFTPLASGVEGYQEG